jgi:hypothetical protein
MAKGKHAAALFEVICTGRKPPKSSSTGGISLPRWWFKGRRKPLATPAPAMADSQPLPQAIEQPAAIEPHPPMRIAGDSPLALDKASGEIRFKLSYAGLAAAGFILIIILTIAYMVGSRSPLVSQTELIRRANIPLTDPPQTSTLLAAVDPSPTAATEAPMPQPAPSAVPTEAPAALAPQSTTTRQVGLNYVVFQSYPDPAVAQRAMDFLIKAGFPCSIVKLPGSSWSSVVSLKGFDHIHKNPELDDYKEKIETLSESFAGRRPFNRFEPTLFKWRPDQQQ